MGGGGDEMIPIDDSFSLPFDVSSCELNRL